MLSRELLVTRKRRPYITPVYIHPEETELAQRIIKVYEKEKVKGEIDAETLALETHSNFRVVRGLSELMRRRTQFEESYSVDPKIVRRYLYGKGYVTGKEREQLLQEASLEFCVSADDIETSFWADREEYQRVSSVDEISASDLVKWYNVSLTQTLLFDALSLEFATSGNYQEIFRMIKYLGLMYEIQSEDETFVTKVTGPASLFRKTKKYGTSLARLIPKIMKAPSWKVKAQIETTVAGEPRIYIFELSDSKRELFPDVTEDTESFDSTVEESFVRRFSSLRRDWEVKREPTILKAGPSVMIPDFSVERRGRKLYIEIVGFWTPEYVEKKIEKIQHLEEKILLCVDRELQCTRKDFQKENVDVIFYEKEVPMKPVLERVKKIEQEQLKEEKDKLSERDIDLGKNVTPLVVLAQTHNVGVETVRETLKSNDTGLIVGDYFVKNSVLQEIGQKIENLEDKRLSFVKEVLDDYGLNETVLGKIGFEIEWKTLDLENAVVKKVQSGHK